MRNRIEQLEAAASARRARIEQLRRNIAWLEATGGEPAHEPEPEPEPAQAPAPAPRAEAWPEPQQAPILDTVMVVCGRPAVDTRPPMRGEVCYALLRARLRQTAEMHSAEVSVLEVGETVKVLETTLLEGGLTRVHCEVRRHDEALRGWVSATASTGEMLLDPGHKRRPRWELGVEYCAEVTPASASAPSLRLADDPHAADFCFPAHQQQLGRLAGEWEGQFCFVRTREDGVRQYGFCSRLCRADGAVEVVCLSTRHPWFAWFRRLLRSIDRMRRADDRALEQARAGAGAGTAVEVFSVSTQQWIRGEITSVERQAEGAGRLFSVVYSASCDPSGMQRRKKVDLNNAALVRMASRGDTAAIVRQVITVLLEASWPALPPPGQQISLSLPRGETLRLARPSDGVSPHSENMEHEQLFSALSVDGVLAVFAAMMLEMRLIFVSSQLTKLSACVHAAAALLLPFSWQHIFVPVLPRIWVRHSLLESPFRRFQPNTG